MPTTVAFEPLDPEILGNPYPLYTRLRDAGPVLWYEPLGAWLVTRHRHCVTVLRDTDHFAADHRRAGQPIPDAEMTVQTLDPPELAAVRGVLSSACRAPDLAAIRQRARQHADELLGRLVENGGGEFMTEFAAPFALAAICDFLGVAPPDLTTLAPIADAMMQGMDAGLQPEREQRAAEARGKLIAIIDTWFDSPSDAGMLSALLAQHSAGKMSRVALMNNLRLTFNAGYHSTFAAIGNATLALLRSEQDLTGLLDPETLDLAVEELLRYDAIAPIMGRLCVKDVELGGERIGRGEMAILLLGAANRDPEQFTNPDDLILDRRPNRHLAFSWGSHICLGAFLARDLIKITLASLRDRAPQIRLSGEPVHKPQAILRCLDRIPVSLGI